MNWPVIIIVAVLLIGLIVFLVWRNIKDEKDMEAKLNNDYHKPKAEESDVDADNAIK